MSRTPADKKDAMAHWRIQHVHASFMPIRPPLRTPKAARKSRDTRHSLLHVEQECLVALSGDGIKNVCRKF